MNSEYKGVTVTMNLYNSTFSATVEGVVYTVKTMRQLCKLIDAKLGAAANAND